MNSTEPTGYDHEEAVFKQQELEALAKLREKLSAQRVDAAASAAKEAHWMRCPKCGGTMSEVAQGGVMIDKCAGCGGVFFDAGELEILVRHEKAGRSILGKLFGKS
ncbi:MAG: zf-TFIIB domain-containing protein [Planctomycetota bacterium]|nr:zf-TFIIB domain-containing protein [Planctomycetota bacterium]MDA1106519.1 zf-TFIIB domain-containing protein [Planctomycetota bacterium]